MGSENGKTYEYSDTYLPGRKDSSRAAASIRSEWVRWSRVSSGSRISRFDPNTGNSLILINRRMASYWIKTQLLVHGIFAAGKIGESMEDARVKTWNPPEVTPCIRGESSSIPMASSVQPVGAGQIAFRSKTEIFQNYPLPARFQPYAMNSIRTRHLVLVGIPRRSRRLDTTGSDGISVPSFRDHSREYFLDAQGRMWYALRPTIKSDIFIWRAAGDASARANRKMSSQPHLVGYWRSSS